jgi:hypothetical protein
MVYGTTRLVRITRVQELAPRPVLRGSLRWAYRLSGAAAVFTLIASLGGLLWGGRGLYDPDPYLLPQLYGQDAVTLALALPLLLFSMSRAMQGSVRALLVWTGALFYLIYSYYFYVLDVRFNALFLIYVATVSTSLYALILLLAHLDPYAIRDRFRVGKVVRISAGFLVGMAALFGIMWLSDILRLTLTEGTLTSVPRLVYAIDLTVVLPALAVVGIWLWQGRAWGYTLAGLLLVKVATLGVTMLINTALAAQWQQRIDPVLTTAFVVLTLGALGCAVFYFRNVREPR